MCKVMWSFVFSVIRSLTVEWPTASVFFIRDNVWAGTRSASPLYASTIDNMPSSGPILCFDNTGRSNEAFGHRNMRSSRLRRKNVLIALRKGACAITCNSGCLNLPKICWRAWRKIFLLQFLSLSLTSSWRWNAVLWVFTWAIMRCLCGRFRPTCSLSRLTPERNRPSPLKR
jgi:hypothetical protein